MKGHEMQTSKHGAYQMHPDNKANLWNMIDKFKRVREDEKDFAIVQKTSNAATQFRKMNQAQQNLELKLRKEAF